MAMAIAGMTDVRYAQSRGIAHSFNLAQDFRQCGARDDPVLHDVIRRDASHGRKSSLASLPYEGALGVRLGDTNFPSSAIRADRGHLLGQFFHFRSRTIQFLA